VSEPTFKGVPLSQLRIEDIYWSEERAQHIRTRSQRAGRSDEFNVEPEWATEAGLDSNRIVRLAASEEPDAQSLKIIGWSDGAHRLLKVWVWSDEPATSSVWNGGSAARANSSDEKRYREADQRR
jgi:hypothetical protein